MRIEILDEAEADLIKGFHFYEGQATGLGSYFLDSPFSDIDSLFLFAGIHEVVYGIGSSACSLGLPAQSIMGTAPTGGIVGDFAHKA